MARPDYIIAAIERKVAEFQNAYPQLVFAEVDEANRWHAVAFVNEQEWDGYGVSLFTAFAEALVMANGGYPKGLPGEGGFIYRQSDGDLARIAKGHRAFERAGL
jgi:hypothetical protein